MQTAFIDGHFILSRRLDEGLCYRRSSGGLLITINNIYFYTNSTEKRQVLKLIYERKKYEFKEINLVTLSTVAPF